MNRNSKTGMILIGLGLFFLLGQTINFGLFWPLFILLPGAVMLYSAYTGNKSQAGLAVPGAIVGGTGAILLFQSLTGLWESWAYAWTLYPVFLGLALSFIGQRTANAETYKTGQGFVRWGGTAFIVLAIIFQVMIFNGGGFLSNLVLPLALIGLGAWMLFGKNSRTEKRKFSEPVYADNLSDKPKNGYTLVNQDLQRKIDEALHEDEHAVQSQ